MGVTFDAKGTGGTVTTSPATWTHTCAATATYLIAIISVDASSGDGSMTASATYNGVAMASVQRWESGGNSAGGVGFVQMFALANPGTGSAFTVSVACTGSPVRISGNSQSYNSAVSLGTPATSDSNATAVTSGSVTVPSSTAGNLIAVGVVDGSGITGFTSGTLDWANTGAAGPGAGGLSSAAHNNAGGSVTTSWTQTSDYYGAIAVEVQGAAATTVQSAPASQLRPPGRRSPVTLARPYQFPAAPQAPPPPPPVQSAPRPAPVPPGRRSPMAWERPYQFRSAPPAVIPSPRVITQIAGGGTGYFADQYGTPRFLMGDNPWGIIPNAGRWAGTWQSDLDTYCNTRGGQGFTAIYLDPLGNTENTGAFADGRTWDGVYPFTVNGTAASTASLAGTETIALNDPFWQRVDYFITACARNGMTAMINAGYNGPGDFASGGAYNTMTATQFGQYGTALAARYVATQGIIWMVGNDYFGGTGGTIGSGGGTPANADAQYNSLLSGLSGGGDTHLISIHNYPESDSRQDLGSGTTGTVQYWGNNHAAFNGCYSYNACYLTIEQAYAETSPIPVMRLDGYFYQGGSTYNGGSGTTAYDRAFRQDAWHAITSGARGHMQGSEGVWEWGSGALAQVTTGWYYVNNAVNVRTLVESLPGWQNLLPDTSSALITSGRGTRASSFTSGGAGGQYEVGFTDTYVSASRTPAGDLAIIYLSHATTITIDQTKLTAGYQAYWADPITGTKTRTPSGATYNSATPGNNSQGDPDWLLILQAAPAAAVPPPGPARARTTPAWPARNRPRTTSAVSIPATITGITGAITLIAPAGTVTAVTGSPGLVIRQPLPLPRRGTGSGIFAVTSAPGNVTGTTGIITVTAPAGTVQAWTGITSRPVKGRPAPARPGTARGTSTGTLGTAVSGVTGQITIAAPAGAVTAVTGSPGRAIRRARPVPRRGTGTGTFAVASQPGVTNGVPGQVTVSAPAGIVQAYTGTTGRVVKVQLPVSRHGRVRSTTIPATAAATAGITGAITLIAPAGTVTAVTGSPGLVIRRKPPAPHRGAGRGIFLVAPVPGVVTGTPGLISVTAPAGTVSTTSTGGTAVTGPPGKLTLTAVIGTVTAVTGTRGHQARSRTAMPPPARRGRGQHGTIAAVLAGPAGTVTLRGPAGTIQAFTGTPGKRARSKTVTPPHRGTAHGIRSGVAAVIAGVPGTITVTGPAGGISTAVPGIPGQISVTGPAGFVVLTPYRYTRWRIRPGFAPAGPRSHLVHGSPGTIRLAAPAGTVAAH